ncbi:MAG: phage tail tube protein [Gammaproteobacteria bacterium]
MTKLVHRTLLLAEVESTYNTDPVPTYSSNSILVQNVTWSQAGLRMEKRPAVRGTSIASLQSVYGGELREISFTAEIKGSGTAGTAPELSPLFQACGLTETIVASTSAVYTPNSSPTTVKSCTMYLYLDGSLCKVTGARGDVSFDIKTGGIMTAKFKMTGHVSSAYTDVTLPTGTFNATIPVAALGVAATVGDYAPVLDMITFGLNNKLEMPPSIGADDGYAEITISERDVKGSFDPELDTEATFNWFSSLSAGTTYAFSTGAIGGTAGNEVTIAMPAIYVEKVASKDRNGILCATVDFTAVESSGVDNEVSITFT